MSKGSVNAPSFFENRRYPRYKADHSIVIEFQNVKTIGFCVDYSEGGFGAIIEAELPIGEIMSVVFPMEDFNSLLRSPVSGELSQISSGKESRVISKAHSSTTASSQ